MRPILFCTITTAESNPGLTSDPIFSCVSYLHYIWTNDIATSQFNDFHVFHVFISAIVQCWPLIVMSVSGTVSFACKCLSVQMQWSKPDLIGVDIWSPCGHYVRSHPGCEEIRPFWHDQVFFKPAMHCEMVLTDAWCKLKIPSWDRDAFVCLSDVKTFIFYIIRWTGFILTLSHML